MNWKLVNNFLAVSGWNLGQFYIGLKKDSPDRYCVVQHILAPYARTFFRGEFGSVDEAVGFTDAMLNAKLGYNTVKLLQRSREWLHKPASPEQRKFLSKLGFKIPAEEELSREKAQFLFLLKGARAINTLDPIQENLTDISRKLRWKNAHFRKMAVQVEREEEEDLS